MFAEWNLLPWLDTLAVISLLGCALGCTARFLWRSVRPQRGPVSAELSDVGQQTGCSSCQVPGRIAGTGTPKELS